MPLQNQYGGSGGVMFNPNETEEEKHKRYQAEFLRSSVSDDQVASQQKEYESLTSSSKGPKGRRVGSRNTFVAASPFEHLAHVGASYLKGKKAKKVKGELEESLAKQATSRAGEKADKRIKDEKLVTIKAQQQEQLGEHYASLDENAKTRLANDALKMKETEKNNIRKHVAAMATLDKANTDFKNTTAGEREKTSTLRSKIRTVTEAGKTFKDSYARPLGDMPVISRAAVRFGTSTGVDPTSLFGGHESDKGKKEGEASNFQDAARWLAGWKMGFTLEERNRIFGATLTPNEQIAWDEAGDINLNMEAGEIKRRVEQIEVAMRGRADDGAFTAYTNRQNLDAWRGMTSPGFDVKTYAAEGAGGAAPQVGPAPEPQREISYKDIGKY